MSTDAVPSSAPTPPAAAVATRTRRLSLRTRWTVTFVLAGAVPLAALGFSTLKIQRDGLLHAEETHQAAVIDAIGQVVEHQLGQAVDATHRVGQLMTEARIPDVQARLALSREATANAGGVARVAIYGSSRAILESIARASDAAGPAAPERLPEVTVPPGADGVWLPAEYTPAGPVLRYVEPVQRDGQVRAWVMGILRAGVLTEAVEEISRDRFAGRPDGVIVLDDAGRVVASGATAGAMAVGQSAAGRDLLAGAGVAPGDFGSPRVASREYTADGQAMVGTVRTLPGRRWAVIARQPASAVFTSLARARRSLAFVAGGFLVLAVLVSFLLVARTVRPIHALMRLAAAYGRRQFKTRSDVRTGDEVELLGDQMVAMADNIVASEAEVARRAQVEANLSRFMPAQVAKSIAAGERSLALGGQRRAVTVLFADVASFTPFAEKTPPERVVAFLNELFGVMTEVVFRYDGAVDKFIGDCVMAVFGAHQDQADHVSRAVSCAEDMQRFVASSATRWKDRYGIEPKLAIGINTGEALVGNLGSDVRMEYTCVGDVVNVAARLEGLAQPGQTLVTAEVAAAVGDDFDLTPMGAHNVRGKQQPVELFELTR